MVTSLSFSMANSLNALLSINSQMEAAQKRINTGKAINDPSDNMVVYFKARSFSDKADLYTNVNSNISQAISNLNFTDKAMSNMIDSIKSTRQILVDAKTKPVNIATPVSFTGAKAYLNNSSLAYTATDKSAKTRAIKGQIVDIASNPNINDGTFFQNGDVFRVDIYDSSNQTTQSRYFKAVAADSAADLDQSKKGDTSANAIEFNDVATLATALNLGFGRATATFDTVTDSTAGTTQLKLTLASNTQSITFGQTTDATQGTGTSAKTGDTFDFSKLLGTASQTGAAVTVGNSLDPNAVAATSTTPQTGAPGAASWTFSPLAGTPSDKSAADVRRQAADTFRQTVYGLDATTKDASLPGFANLLRGDTMTVYLNDTNTTSQAIKLSQAIDFTAATSATYGVGFAQTNGSITTAYTDTGAAGNDNFQSDNIIGSAIAKLDSMAIMLGQQRQLLGAAKTSLSSRLDLNKAFVSALTDSANNMTAADLATESANMATLQNRQSFAATSLNISRQSEQVLLGLLR